MKLLVKNLVMSVKNEKLPILSVDNLSLNSGSSLVVRGESGSGKTTFLNLISAIETPSSGEIWWDEIDITKLNSKQKDEFRALNLGIVMQNFYLSLDMSALDNILLLNLFLKNKAITKEKACEILNLVGISNFTKALKFFSRGQMQRIAIARALCLDPKVLICDEPTASLDRQNAINIAKLFKQIAKNKTLIISSHDENIIAEFENVLTIEKNKPINWGEKC
ncbi:MAG: ATP-binding cassette domain-containing protein [Campylobacter sp.]|nr:ATP-binding cassette domain-containing protein [Campylobacter sp.]